MNRIVFVLRSAGVVKLEIRKIGRRMTNDAVADAAFPAVVSVRGEGCHREEDLHSIQFLRPKTELLPEGLEAAIQRWGEAVRR